MSNVIKIFSVILFLTISLISHAQNLKASVSETAQTTIEDLDLLKKTLLWTEEDDKYLKIAGNVLENQLEEVLDVWYGYVGSNKHLVFYFNSNGKPSSEYLKKVRERFKQWVLDLCYKSYDENWLNYQNEIGLRHNSKKGETDKIANTPEVVH